MTSVCKAEAGSDFGPGLTSSVTFPNGVFSGVIISSVVNSEDTLRSTGEWQLLLGALSLPGVFLGAWLCNRIGRKQTMMLGFSGYLVFGLIIGCAYDKITKVRIPTFSSLCPLITELADRSTVRRLLRPNAKLRQPWAW